MNRICLDGNMVAAGAPVLLASNKSYRYGDGIFETMKVTNGAIQLENLHFERLFASLSLLGYQRTPGFNAQRLKTDILRLCERNGCSSRARVRLSVSRGNGGLNDYTEQLQYVIECWPLDESTDKLNENGLTIGIFPDARKSCDKFSGLKSASHLVYVMAAHYARDHRLNDSIVLNSHERIADTSIANIFIVKNGRLLTPALTEGCIAGVMRKNLINKYGAEETQLTENDLLTADEIFLTNAVQVLRWVRQFRDNTYGCTLAAQVHGELVNTATI